jgi:hypothetical protein
MIEHPCVPLQPQRPHDEQDERVGRSTIRCREAEDGQWPPLPKLRAIRGHDVRQPEASNST